MDFSFSFFPRNYHGGNDRGDYYRQQFRHHDEPMHGNGRSSLPRSTSAYSYRDSTSSLFSNDSHGSGSVGTKESHREGSRGEKLDPEQGYRAVIFHEFLNFHFVLQYKF